MKHHRLCTAGVLLFTLLAGMPRAEVHAAPLGAGLGVYGSYWDSDDLDEGLGLGAKLRFDLLEIVALDLRGSWMEFDDSDLTVYPVEATLLLQLTLGDLAQLYVGPGAGYYFMDSDRADLEDEPGFYLLGGVETNLFESFALFAEARWLALEPDLESNPDNWSDLEDSVELGGLGLNAGVVFRW